MLYRTTANHSATMRRSSSLGHAVPRSHFIVQLSARSRLWTSRAFLRSSQMTMHKFRPAGTHRSAILGRSGRACIPRTAALVCEWNTPCVAVRPIPIRILSTAAFARACTLWRLVWALVAAAGLVVSIHEAAAAVRLASLDVLAIPSAASEKGTLWRPNADARLRAVSRSWQRWATSLAGEEMTCVRRLVR